MRCYICDTEIMEPKFDENHLAEPCGDCQEAIAETLQDFEEEASDDDETGLATQPA